MKTYPENIMQNIRQNMGLEKDDTSRDEEIMALDVVEAFNRYCIWECLLGGYGYMRWKVVDQMRKTKGIK